MSTADKVGFEVCAQKTGVKCWLFFARNKRAFSSKCGFAVYTIDQNVSFSKRSTFDSVFKTMKLQKSLITEINRA